MKKPEMQARRFPFLNLVLYLFYFLLVLTFFFLLDKQKHTGFGFSQIIAALLAGILLASILVGVRSFMLSNPLLWFILGLAIVGSLLYGLFMKFAGPYTLVFAAVGSIVWILYLLLYFFKYKKFRN